MGWATNAIKRCLGRTSPYGTVELTDEVITDLHNAMPDRHAVSIQPNKDGGGITNGIDLLTAVHTASDKSLPVIGSSSAPTHAFEMRNVDGKIGFQYVMGRDKDQRQLERQLETFYPDAHIEVSEHPNPPLLPLEEGRHMAAAKLRLRRRENGEHYYPIKHIDVEGFENDPYGSITAEMIGERESNTVTDIAVQVVFEPAPADWWQGGLFSDGIDEIADELKNPHKEHTMVDALKYEARPEKHTLEGEEREASDQDRKASKIIRRQRGEKGFRLNVRVLAVSDDPEMAIARVDETCEMFEGYYESTTEQGFEPVPQKKGLKKTLERAHARERTDEKMVMGVRSAAGLMHVPNDSINTQHIEWSLTSHAGDVPADATRFSDWHCAESTRWEGDDRSHVADREAWEYDIVDPAESESEQPADPDSDTQKEVNA